MPKSTFVRELERLSKSPNERVRLIAAQSLARIQYRQAARQPIKYGKSPIEHSRDLGRFLQ